MMSGSWFELTVVCARFSNLHFAPSLKCFVGDMYDGVDIAERCELVRSRDVKFGSDPYISREQNKEISCGLRF